MLKPVGDLRALLEAGLTDLGLVVDSIPCTAYLRYMELLIKWNQTYNLIAANEPKVILNRHVLDSLSVWPFISGVRCLDIGTGAGLPGMMLALMQPEKHWTLLDSSQKKIRFLRHVSIQLNINNIELVHSRIEDFMPAQEFDTVICRAVAPLTRLLKQAQHLLTKENQLLAMKGRQADKEVTALGDHPFSIRLNELSLPEKALPVTLLQIRRAG